MSQKREWLRFVEKRRRELHDVYPCALPTDAASLPEARQRASAPVTGICKPCRDELYEQLAGEYLHSERRSPCARARRQGWPRRCRP